MQGRPQARDAARGLPSVEKGIALSEDSGEGSGAGAVEGIVAHGAAGKAHHLGQSVQRYFLLLARATQLHLHLALFQAAAAHDDLPRASRRGRRR